MSDSAQKNINVFWFLPTHGDGRYLGTTEGGARRRPAVSTAGRAGR